MATAGVAAASSAGEGPSVSERDASLSLPMQTIIEPPSPFQPNHMDKYSKPKKNQLVSYLWHEPSDYRTGVHRGNDNIIFYNEVLCKDGTYDVFSKDFYMTKKRFKNGDFRPRLDLDIGSRCYDTERKRWGTLTKIDASTGGVRALFDGNSHDLFISPDNLVGTASHAIAAGEIQPARKQRNEVETTRTNEFPSLVQRIKEFRTRPGRKRSSTFVEDFETSKSTIDEPSSDDLRESSSGNQMEAPHVNPKSVSVSSPLEEPNAGMLSGSSSENQTETLPLDFQGDQVDNISRLACDELALMESTGLSDSATPLFEAQLTGDKHLDDQTNRQCFGPSATEETPPSPFRPNPDDEYTKPKKNELVTYVWHRPNYYRTGVHWGNDHIAFYNESTLDDGTLDVYSKYFYLTKKRFQDGDFRPRPDLSTGCRCYDTHRKRWGIITIIEASSGGVRVLFEGSMSAILISPDDLVGAASHASSLEIQSAAPQDSDLQTTCKRNRKPSLSIQSLDELQNQGGRIPPSISVGGSTASLSLGKGSTETEPLREIEDDFPEFPSENHQAEAVDLETLGRPDGNDDVYYQASRECSGAAIAKFTECNRPLLPRVEMQPIDESRDGWGEDSDDETSQESNVPSPFRPHPDDEYVKPRRNEFISYLWEKPDLFRTGLLQSTDRIAFYNEATRDDGTLDVYSKRFELNKKRFKDEYFRARPDLVPGGRCYDSERMLWCTLREIDVTSGGVSVIFDGDEEVEFISPDHLVGVSSRPSKKRHYSLVAEGEAREENDRAKKVAKCSQSSEVCCGEEVANQQKHLSPPTFRHQRSKVVDVSYNLDLSPLVGTTRQPTTHSKNDGSTSDKGGEVLLDQDDCSSCLNFDFPSLLENPGCDYPKLSQDSRVSDVSLNPDFYPLVGTNRQAGPLDNDLSPMSAIASDEPGEYDASTSYINNTERNVFNGETDDPGPFQGYHQGSVLPSFKPNPEENYRKPRRNELVSYLWTEPDYYRTGVHRSSDRVIFYDDGKQKVYSGCFELSKKRFKDGFFRSRPDLVPGTFCYDTELEKWCTLKEIDVTTGGVYVVYEGDKERLLISPDGLVGIDSNLSRKRSRRSQTPEDNATQEQFDCISTLSSPVERSIDDDAFASISTHENGDGPFKIARASENPWKQIRGRSDPPGNVSNSPTIICNSEVPSPPAPSAHTVYHDRQASILEQASTILREEGSIDDQSSESSETGYNVCQDSGLRANSGPCVENTTLEVGHESDSVLPCDYAVSHSDSSDEVETRNTDDTAPHPPHEFRPNAEDEYVKPRRNQLISYLWGKPAIYRTGVLRSRDSIVFFEESEGDDGDPTVFTGRFELSKKWFKRGFFRTRLDLVPSRRCYDTERKKWCVLRKIGMTCGGVLVSFDGSTKDEFISPDNLVGIVSKEDGLEDDWSSHGKDTSELQNPGLLGSNAMYNPKDIRLGVAQGFDEASDFGWYIRGKLCFSGGLAKLLAGERVTFSKKDYRPVSKYLEFNSMTRSYIDDLGSNQVDRIKNFARLGEEKYAKEPQTIRSLSRAARLRSLRLRPLQPIEVLGLGEAIVLCPQDKHGFVKIRHGDTERIELVESIRPLGFKQDPVDVEQFFMEQTDGLPKQSESYRKEPSYLLDSWRTANDDDEMAASYINDFRKLVDERGKIRSYASGDTNEPLCGFADKLSIEVAQRLRQRATELHVRLLADYHRPLQERMMLPDDFMPRIVEIKNTSPFANVLLLCGGIAPELTVYKRLGVPLGKVILQDTDLHAVGVAVAAHPDIEFLIVCHQDYEPGDIRILRQKKIVRRLEIDIGGIHDVHITNPCQTFSLAGKKEGFDAASGRLFWDAIVILRNIKESSEMPRFLAENVYGTHENNDNFDNYLGYNFFEACGSMCSAQSRKRRFATNQPPAICATGPIRSPDEPPSLNGDLPEYCAQAVLDEDLGRIVPRKLKKFRCLMHSKPTEFKDIWTQEDPDQAPERAQMTAEEAERSMGYSKSEVKLTRFSAEKAVRKRIAEHDFLNGDIVSLKGCANDKDTLEEVPEKRRLQLLGNSEVVTLLEAIMWNSRQLFPPICST